MSAHRRSRAEPDPDVAMVASVRFDFLHIA
jgi:hypothetical protein